MDDVRAVQRALAGDEAGYRQLYRRHHTRLWHYVASLGLGDPDAVADIVQESFVRTFKSLGQLQDPAKFYGMLRVTARNRCYSAFAKAKRQHEILSAAWEQARVCARPESGRQERGLAVLQHIINELPEGEIKETVHEYYLGQGMSTAALAEQLGVPKGTITARLKRFRDQTRRRLAMGLLEVDYELE